MPSSSNKREHPRIEQKSDNGTPSAADSLGFHWPEYLMEAGEAGLYLFSACTVATLLWHPLRQSSNRSQLTLFAGCGNVR
jgi:hypothetical protein